MKRQCLKKKSKEKEEISGKRGQRAPEGPGETWGPGLDWAQEGNRKGAQGTADGDFI